MNRENPPQYVYSLLQQVLDANATMVGLVIEAVASLAEACDPGFEEIFLRKALYPLLEKVICCFSRLGNP